MPHPWLGSQFSPSSSESDIRLHFGPSCEAKVRPVRKSVNRIGSRVARPLFGAVLSTQRSVSWRLLDRHSSRVIRNTSRAAMYMAAFGAFRMCQAPRRPTPIEGSPALAPIPDGGSYWNIFTAWLPGGGGGGGAAPSSNTAVAL